MTGHGELSRNVLGLGPLLDYYAFLRGRLREIRENRPIFSKNPDFEIEEKVVRSEFARLRKLMKSELPRRKKKPRLQRPSRHVDRG